jgi:hypothetical protein
MDLHPTKKYTEAFLTTLFWGVFSIGKEMIDSSEDISTKMILIAGTTAGIFMIVGVTQAVADLRSQISQRDSEITFLRSQIAKIKELNPQ